MYSRNHDLVKFPIVAAFAVLVTSGLFYLMQSLVADDQLQVIPDRPIFDPQITFRNPPIIVQHESPDRPEPPEPIEMTALSKLEEPAAPAPNEYQPRSSFQHGDFPGLESLGGAGTESENLLQDGNALPLKQVLPVYPTNASINGIEGFVLVEFDINPLGQVVNPRVLYAEPENIFNRSALNAITRWTFVPKKENGREIFQYNERRRLTFSMND